MLQFIFYILSFIILIYYTANILVLFSEDALRNVTLARMAFWSVHFLTGLVIMVPVLLVSFLPLFVDLQTRMLFNEDFSERYVFCGNGARLVYSLLSEIMICLVINLNLVSKEKVEF